MYLSLKPRPSDKCYSFRNSLRVPACKLRYCRALTCLEVLHAQTDITTSSSLHADGCLHPGGAWRSPDRQTESQWRLFGNHLITSVTSMHLKNNTHIHQAAFERCIQEVRWNMQLTHCKQIQVMKIFIMHLSKNSHIC